jgi:serine protease AprX
MRRTTVAAALAAAGVAALAAAAAPAGARSAATDPPRAAGPVILMGADGRAVLVDPVVRAVPPSAAELAAKAPAPAPRPAAALDPRLAAAVRDPAAAKTQRVLIGFAEDVAIPRFPELDPDLARDSPANVAARSRADALVAGLQRQRQPGYQAISSQLGQLGVRTLDTFWLVKGMEVEAPLSALAAIAQRPDVTVIQPAVDGSPPPREPAESVARGLMNTDPLFRLGLADGYVGILDTGIQANHAMFNNELDHQEHPWVLQDLVHPQAPDLFEDPCQHGTRTMGVINGNSRLNAEIAGINFDYRGVTGVTVDSFKVYGNPGELPGSLPGECGLDAAAAVRGFQNAVGVLDRVIVAEVQAVEPQNGMVATAADQAYDAGAVVVAANGNTDPTAPVGSVSSPASARKVLGIGAVDPTTLATKPYQNRGPTADLRTKPDLQAPTDLATANSHAPGDQSVVDVQAYGGTSGAVAQAAGAATLVRNRMRGTSFDFPPGYVYAHLLARGTNTGVGALDNNRGAGMVTLATPGSSVSAVGSTVVGDQQTVDIAVPPITSTKPLHVAIWWPDLVGRHADIDVTVSDDSGVRLASSASVSSVFETVTYAGPRTGNWHLRVRGFNVPQGSQLVFWSVSEDL